MAIPTRTWEAIRALKALNSNSIQVVNDSSDSHPFFFIQSAPPTLPTSITPPQTGAAAATDYTDFGFGININAWLDTTTGLQTSASLAYGSKTVRLALAGLADTGAGIGVWLNPETSNIWISEVIVVSTHISTGACHMDVGATAASATTVADNLIDGIDLTQAVPNVNANTNSPNADSTNNKNGMPLASGGWITFSTVAGGASAGFTGYAYIVYKPLP